MATQKITVHVDQALLRRARKSTGNGVRDTIRQGLTLVAAGAAYQKLRALRGRVKFSVDPRTLREDRC
jgi:SAM-dependent MidA family methyltransferase